MILLKKMIVLLFSASSCQYINVNSFQRDKYAIIQETGEGLILFHNTFAALNHPGIPQREKVYVGKQQKTKPKCSPGFFKR